MALRLGHCSSFLETSCFKHEALQTKRFLSSWGFQKTSSVQHMHFEIRASASNVQPLNAASLQAGEFFALLSI